MLYVHPKGLMTQCATAFSTNKRPRSMFNCISVIVLLHFKSTEVFHNSQGQIKFQDSYQIPSPSDERNGTIIDTQVSGRPITKSDVQSQISEDILSPSLVRGLIFIHTKQVL